MKTTNFSPIELAEYYLDNKVMFFTRFTLYQLFYSHNGGYYFQKVTSYNSPFCLRGKFYAMTPKNAQAYNNKVMA